MKVTSTLKPASQCRAAARTAQTVLSQIGRTFHYRDRHIFVKLYKQYVRPHLEFSTVAWSPWSESDKDVIEDVQRRAIRMVSGLTGRTYDDKLDELGLTTLTERRHQVDMQQVYKILKGIDKVGTMFTMSSQGERATRSATDPLHSHCTKGETRGQETLFYSTCPWTLEPNRYRYPSKSETLKMLTISRFVTKNTED